MKKLALFTIVFLFPAMIAGQSVDSFNEFRQSMLNNYSSFKTETMNNYNSFRDSINHRYAKNIEKEWEERDINQSKTIPEFDRKPITPVIRENDAEDTIVSVEFTPTILPPTPIIVEQPMPYIPIEKDKSIIESEKFSFSYYGTQMVVSKPIQFNFALKGLDNQSISNAWINLSKCVSEQMLNDCLNIRTKHQLCDWAYLNMLGCLSERCCGGKSNKSVLLQSYLFSQSGYKIRLARSSDKLYLLFASKHTIYNLSYYEIEGEVYYPLDCDESSLHICQASYPQEESLSLIINKEQLLGGDSFKSITLSTDNKFHSTAIINKDLLNFYSSYPTSSYDDNVMTRWAMYANTPLSKRTSDSLYEQLKSKVENLTDVKAVQYLLTFVQLTFEYKTDDDVWGEDRAFFSEETLYYPYADCEDRSIVFTRLVRDLLGLRCALIYTPGHLFTAVNIPNFSNGNAMIIDDERFVVCDPTYINSSVGMIMPRVDISKAQAIILE